MPDYLGKHYNYNDVEKLMRRLEGKGRGQRFFKQVNGIW